MLLGKMNIFGSTDYVLVYVLELSLELRFCFACFRSLLVFAVTNMVVGSCQVPGTRYALSILFFSKGTTTIVSSTSMLLPAAAAAAAIGNCTYK